MISVRQAKSDVGPVPGPEGFWDTVETPPDLWVPPAPLHRCMGAGDLHADDPVEWLDLEGLEGRLLFSGSADLVAHWTFDETGGAIAADSSPFGIDNSAALVGDAAWDPTGGLFGGALRLDGAGDYLAVANSSDINIGIFDRRTIALWFKVDDTSISAHKQVIYEEGGGTRGLNIYVYDGRLYFGGWNRNEAGWSGDWISTDAIESNTWYHVALVLDGADTVQPDALTAYLDGAVVGTSPGSQLWSHSGDIRLGSSGNSRYHDGTSGDGELGGSLDDARIYNRALDAEDVGELANSPPVAADMAVATDEDVPVIRQLDVIDPEADPLTYTIVDAPAHGTITAFDAATGEFTYLGDPDYYGTDSFTFEADDGQYASNTATVTITINPVNDAPVADDSAFATNEDNSHVGMLTATDVDSGALLYAIVAGPADGAITFFDPTTGAFIYQPGSDYNGADSFSFRATDGLADSNVATVSITVTAVNDAPTANDDALTVEEDGFRAAAVTGADVDTGDVLTYGVVTGPAHGTITAFDAATGEFIYQGDPDYNGTDSFTFKVNDGAADSNVATVSIAVTAVNDAPTATGDAVTIDEDGLHAGVLMAADIDAADTLTYVIVTGPAHGTIAAFDAATGDFVYEPDADYNGTDGFTFLANDGTADSNLATVTITVTAVNDAPVAYDDAVTTDEDDCHVGQLTATDADGAGALVYAIVTGPTHGVITFFDPTTGAFLYQPGGDYNGIDSFTFAAGDGFAESNVATIGITVTAVNDAPVAIDQAFTMAEDGVHAAVLAGTDVDAGDVLTCAILTGPAHGSIVDFDAATGAFTYRGDDDYNGTDSFTFVVNDGTTDSHAATVSITLSAVNDAPTADDSAISLNEDGAYVGVLPAADVDAGDSLVFTIAGGAAHGTLTTFDAATGAFTYLPDGNYNGTDSFTFIVNDGTVDSNTATVFVSVLAVNDAPVISAPPPQYTSDVVRFSPLNNNAVTVDDIDLGTNLLRVTIAVTGGTVSLGGTGGLTLLYGDGRNDTMVIFTGTLANVNGLTGSYDVATIQVYRVTVEAMPSPKAADQTVECVDEAPLTVAEPPESGAVNVVEATSVEPLRRVYPSLGADDTLDALAMATEPADKAEPAADAEQKAHATQTVSAPAPPDHSMAAGDGRRHRRPHRLRPRVADSRLRPMAGCRPAGHARGRHLPAPSLPLVAPPHQETPPRLDRRPPYRRNSRGVMPVMVLKVRDRWNASAKPVSPAIASNVSRPRMRCSFAASTRKARNAAMGVRPAIRRYAWDRADSDRPTQAARSRRRMVPARFSRMYL